MTRAVRKLSRDRTVLHIRVTEEGYAAAGDGPGMGGPRGACSERGWLPPGSEAPNGSAAVVPALGLVEWSQRGPPLILRISIEPI